MFQSINQRRPSLTYRTLSAFVAFTFIVSSVITPTYAQLIPQTVLNLPVPGTVVPVSPGYTPALIKSITVHPDNPLKFDFIIDRGDDRIEGDELVSESKKMIKYFLATLTIPDDEVWVNLSPYEKDRIIPEGLSVTELGRDMLAQDYMLKQLTASMMNPEDALGKKFWDRVYDKAQRLYGSTDIPMNTFNKIWIVPEKGVIYQNESTAFVVERHLKVMLEDDYVAAQRHGEDGRGKREDGTKQKNPSSNVDFQSSIIRDVLIPEIEKEVNEGTTFANLRQIYDAMLLATWYKMTLKEGFLGQVYMNKNKTAGVDVQDKQIKQKIYDQYLAAFKKGVYNYIKEDYDPATQQIIPRKYFSGGANGWRPQGLIGQQPKIRIEKDSAMLTFGQRRGLTGADDNAFNVQVNLVEADANGDNAIIVQNVEDAAGVGSNTSANAAQAKISTEGASAPGQEVSIDQLELTRQTKTVLRRDASIETISQLIQKTAPDLARLGISGQLRMAEIRTALADKGLSLVGEGEIVREFVASYMPLERENLFVRELLDQNNDLTIGQFLARTPAELRNEASEEIAIKTISALQRKIAQQVKANNAAARTADKAMMTRMTNAEIKKALASYVGKDVFVFLRLIENATRQEMTVPVKVEAVVAQGNLLAIKIVEMAQTADYTGSENEIVVGVTALDKYSVLNIDMAPPQRIGDAGAGVSEGEKVSEEKVETPSVSEPVVSPYAEQTSIEGSIAFKRMLKSWGITTNEELSLYSAEALESMGLSDYLGQINESLQAVGLSLTEHYEDLDELLIPFLPEGVEAASVIEMLNRRGIYTMTILENRMSRNSLLFMGTGLEVASAVSRAVKAWKERQSPQNVQRNDKLISEIKEVRNIWAARPVSKEKSLRLPRSRDDQVLEALIYLQEIISTATEPIGISDILKRYELKGMNNVTAEFILGALTMSNADMAGMDSKGPFYQPNGFNLLENIEKIAAEVSSIRLDLDNVQGDVVIIQERYFPTSIHKTLIGFIETVLLMDGMIHRGGRTFSFPSKTDAAMMGDGSGQNLMPLELMERLDVRTIDELVLYSVQALQAAGVSEEQANQISADLERIEQPLTYHYDDLNELGLSEDVADLVLPRLGENGIFILAVLTDRVRRNPELFSQIGLSAENAETLSKAFDAWKQTQPSREGWQNVEEEVSADAIRSAWVNHPVSKVDNKNFKKGQEDRVLTALIILQDIMSEALGPISVNEIMTQYRYRNVRYVISPAFIEKVSLISNSILDGLSEDFTILVSNDFKVLENINAIAELVLLVRKDLAAATGDKVTAQNPSDFPKSREAGISPRFIEAILRMEPMTELHDGRGSFSFPPTGGDWAMLTDAQQAVLNEINELGDKSEELRTVWEKSWSARRTTIIDEITNVIRNISKEFGDGQTGYLRAVIEYIRPPHPNSTVWKTDIDAIREAADNTVQAIEESLKTPDNAQLTDVQQEFFDESRRNLFRALAGNGAIRANTIDYVRRHNLEDTIIVAFYVQMILGPNRGQSAIVIFNQNNNGGVTYVPVLNRNNAEVKGLEFVKGGQVLEVTYTSGDVEGVGELFNNWQSLKDLPKVITQINTTFREKPWKINQGITHFWTGHAVSDTNVNPARELDRVLATLLFLQDFMSEAQGPISLDDIQQYNEALGYGDLDRSFITTVFAMYSSQKGINERDILQSPNEFNLLDIIAELAEQVLLVRQDLINAQEDTVTVDAKDFPKSINRVSKNFIEWILRRDGMTDNGDGTFTFSRQFLEGKQFMAENPRTPDNAQLSRVKKADEIWPAKILEDLHANIDALGHLVILTDWGEARISRSEGDLTDPRYKDLGIGINKTTGNKDASIRETVKYLTREFQESSSQEIRDEARAILEGRLGVSVGPAPASISVEQTKYRPMTRQQKAAIKALNELSDEVNAIGADSAKDWTTRAPLISFAINAVITKIVEEFGEGYASDLRSAVIISNQRIGPFVPRIDPEYQMELIRDEIDLAQENAPAENPPKRSTIDEQREAERILDELSVKVEAISKDGKRDWKVKGALIAMAINEAITTISVTFPRRRYTNPLRQAVKISKRIIGDVGIEDIKMELIGNLINGAKKELATDNAQLSEEQGEVLSDLNQLVDWVEEIRKESTSQRTLLTDAIEDIIDRIVTEFGVDNAIYLQEVVDFLKSEHQRKRITLRHIGALRLAANNTSWALNSETLTKRQQGVLRDLNKLATNSERISDIWVYRRSSIINTIESIIEDISDEFEGVETTALESVVKKLSRGNEGDRIAPRHLNPLRNAVRVTSLAIEKSLKGSDNAQLGTPVGGINLDPSLLDLQIKRDANFVPLPIEQQPINLDIEGFIPVIINVTPVQNLPLLLGFNETDTEPNQANNDPNRPLFDRKARFESNEISLVR